MELKMKGIVHALSFLYVLTIPVECVPELQLLHIIFAHKTYAPILDLINSNETSIPSNLTYEHFTSASFDMPNSGKLNMYNLGVHLRETYGTFLGDLYRPPIMKMRTAEYPLSIISGQLVNAGLWPPVGSQIWNSDLNWQPIPSEYVFAEEDTLLLGFQCPGFISEKRKVLSTDGVRKTVQDHSSLFDYVSRYTGMDIKRPSEVALLYAALETAADLNQTLPNWAEDIFPHGEMYIATLLEYDLLSETPLQRQLNGGTFLKEILGNSLEYIRGSMSKMRKLMIYSGNERNIVAILKSLDLWSPHIPNEAASLIFEMYFDNVTQSHGIKINYYTGVEGETIPLIIPNCTVICPLETLLDSFFHLVPENSELLCNWRRIDLSDETILADDTIYSGSESHKLKSITISFLLLTILSVYQSAYTI